MTVAQKVQAVLIADSGVTALVDAARIKLPGDWQQLPRPYIVHFPVAGTGIQTYSEGLANLKRWSYQVTCVGNTYSSAEAVAIAVRNILGDYRVGGIQSFWSGNGPALYDADLKVHEISIDFEIHDAL